MTNGTLVFLGTHCPDLEKNVVTTAETTSIDLVKLKAIENEIADILEWEMDTFSVYVRVYSDASKCLCIGIPTDLDVDTFTWTDDCHRLEERLSEFKEILGCTTSIFE